MANSFQPFACLDKQISSPNYFKRTALDVYCVVPFCSFGVDTNDVLLTLMSWGHIKNASSVDAKQLALEGPCFKGSFTFSAI